MTPRPTARSAFTLLELILSVAVLVVLVAILVQVTSDVQRLWRRGADTTSTAREAKIALDILAEDIAAAVARDTLADGFSDNTGANKRHGPTLFAFAPDADTASPLTPADCASHYSYLLLTRRLARPVWEEKTGTDTDEATSSWIATTRTAPDSGDETPLRSLLGVYYHVDPDTSAEDAAQEEEGESSSSTRLRYHLVRGTTGFGVPTNEEQTDSSKDDLDWCRNPSDAGEILAHNVVTFSITVPEFSVAETNGEYTVRTEYSTHPNFPGVSTVGPLPTLVDITLGLIPERDMQQIESLPASTSPSRQQFLERRVRVYTRRVRIR